MVRPLQSRSKPLSPPPCRPKSRRCSRPRFRVRRNRLLGRLMREAAEQELQRQRRRAAVAAIKQARAETAPQTAEAIRQLWRRCADESATSDLPTCVVDASVAVKWFVPQDPEETDSVIALELLDAYADDRLRLVEPPIWRAEVAAVLARLLPDRLDSQLTRLWALDYHDADSEAVLNKRGGWRSPSTIICSIPSITPPR